MRLDLVVGPNGAGKTTFVELLLAPLRPGVAFVNADVIAARQWPQDPAGHSYDAARVAAQTRERLLALREPLIAETVFSHPSKLDLLTAAHAAGYSVVLHVIAVPEELSVQRVGHRVVAGGHTVPEAKVRQRYHRLWPLVAQAVEHADTTHVWDNSGWAGPQEIALLARGVPLGRCRWPAWTPTALTTRWPA